MKERLKTPYFYGMLAGFGAIALSVVFFFILYRLQGISSALDRVTEILSPFIYGGVIAYLLRPMCNWFEKLFEKWLPKKLKKMANTLAVALSMVTGLLIVYALIIMIAPELYKSVVTIWNALPENVDRLITWLSVTFAEQEELIALLDTGYETVYSALNGWIQNTLVPYATNIVSGVGQGVWKTLIFLKNILIGLIVAIYLLGSRKRFAKQGVMLVRSMLRPR